MLSTWGQLGVKKPGSKKCPLSQGTHGPWLGHSVLTVGQGTVALRHEAWACTHTYQLLKVGLQVDTFLDHLLLGTLLQRTLKAHLLVGGEVKAAILTKDSWDFQNPDPLQNSICPIIMALSLQWRRMFVTGLEFHYVHTWDCFKPSHQHSIYHWGFWDQLIAVLFADSAMIYQSPVSPLCSRLDLLAENRRFLECLLGLFFPPKCITSSSPG